MRDITKFIKDLRKCKAKEEELKLINQELANIRSKFKANKSLNGYQKKICVCKLLYVFLLGHKNCVFGHMEAITLISSNVYSEKQIGYLYISVVAGNDNKFMLLVINSIKNDLSSDNTLFQYLALQFVANNVCRNVTDSLVGQVLDILLSIHTVDFVKQTAALSLLQILRIQTNLTFDESEANRIINLLSHYHLGVVTASASLIDFLAKAFTSQFQPCLPQCIARLGRIVNSGGIHKSLHVQDYCYYFTTAPWLTIKLLRILQNFPAPTDEHLKSKLKESLNSILNKTQDPLKSNKQNNSVRYAVIFEAISLIIRTELDVTTLCKAIDILGSALYQKESNIRFMALDLMTQLSNSKMLLQSVRQQWESVLNALRNERDITIKKQAVDLLYTICDENNFKPIVDEMLHFLQVETDYSVEAVLKTAALAEQFGAKSQWYVDTMQGILQICDCFVDDSIWYTLVKVIKGNDTMQQEYAARVSYAALHGDRCRGTVVKAAGYILGEFGYLIAKDPKSSPTKQLNTLRKIYSSSTPSARPVLLTTFIKFLNNYPHLKGEVQSIFRERCNNRSGDEEIQQRAVEYLKLSEIASSSLLASVLEEMPSPARRESAVVAAMTKQRSQAFKIGHFDRNSTVAPFRSYLYLSLDSGSSDIEGDHVDGPTSDSNPQHVIGASSPNLNLLMDVLKETPVSKPDNLQITPVPRPQIQDFPTNEKFLSYLLFNEAGVLFENFMIGVLIDCEFEKHLGRFRLKFTNKFVFPFSDFAVGDNFADVMLNKCSAWFKPVSSPLLEVNESAEQVIHLECLGEFSAKPSITLKLACNSRENEIRLVLPLTLNKFFEASPVNRETFCKMWRNFETLGQEVVKEFTAKQPMIYEITRQKLRGFRVYVVENNKQMNFYCAGIFHKSSGRVGFLFKLERFLAANKYRSTVRSSQLNLCEIISDLLFQLL